MANRSDAPLLAVEGLQAWYGESHVLHGVTFEVRAGEVVTLLGRNGAGKTTTLKSIMGIVGRRAGSVCYEGSELIGLTSDRIARLGLAFCPEERGIFANLNVEENLLLPPKVRPGGLDLDRIFALFPNLNERLRSPGTKLSGGEQQMLAIGRALMADPELILMDEPSEGLSPRLVLHVREIMQRLRERGHAILLVEQNLEVALAVADQVYVLTAGRFVFQGTPTALAHETQVLDQHLGVSAAALT
jgi:branched-chain amino acid transport system ATP-binding protein